MPGQLGLEGFESAALPTDRLFFAIMPDAAGAARIGRLAQQLRVEHGLKGKLILPERLHVTLHHLGDYAGLPQDIATCPTCGGGGEDAAV